MRIISGTHKGRVIHPPKNLRARPTTDFAKESLFNILANMVEFEGVDVLDLFAGTGSISYEFASRGAASVTAVEINTIHYNYIRKMTSEFGFANLRVIKANVFLFLKNTKNSWDIIFSDAPFDLDGASEIVDTVLSGDMLRSGGVFIFEHSKDDDFSTKPHFIELRSYGSVYFSLFRRE